ncbi:MAG: Holliday junction branch migration protein RuvA [Chlamydiota bacterium]
MYEYLKGTLVAASPLKAVVDVHGVGYSLTIPFNNYTKLPSLGSSVTLYTTLVVREDSQRLFGFLSEEQRALFESLIDVSGIGPKTGVALIGHMEVNELQAAITQGNTQIICKIPGIGKKTAERLVVEMRDKIKKTFIGGVNSAPTALQNENSIVHDALSALLNLGYNQAQSQKALTTALGKIEGDPELAQLITSALRHI